MIKTNNLSPLTFTIPVSNSVGNSIPSHITGQLIFRMNCYTEQSGELDRDLSCRFYFDPKCWVVSRHGLVYGDDSFIKELWRQLDARGWQCPEALDYSEAGMQGHEYIDMDVSNDKEIFLDLLQSGTTVVDRWPDIIDMNEPEVKIYISDDVAIMSSNEGDHEWIKSQQEKDTESDSGYSLIEGCIKQSVGTAIESVV